MNKHEVELNKLYLQKANLQRAYLQRANLQGANLQRATLQGANLQGANLQRANLQGANLRWGNLREANLQGVDLRGANLQGANLRGANLKGADLREANLRGANLREANLSGVVGLLSAAQWIKDNLSWEDSKLICYKAIGGTHFPLNPNWIIEPGNFLEEVPEPNRSTLCGCGVNVGTYYYVTKEFPNSEVWKCYIHPEDLVDVVIPYNTDGKFRAAKIQLVEIIQERK